MGLVWLIGLRTAFIRDGISLPTAGLHGPKMVLFTGHDDLRRGD